jgi:hypothetical protein
MVSPIQNDISSELTDLQITPRQKTPIIFTLQREKPDVRIDLFDQEFHIHSLALRTHSLFFRTFLDSADKANIVPATTGFKYEYVTKVDTDGDGWNLVHPSHKVSFRKRVRVTFE